MADKSKATPKKPVSGKDKGGSGKPAGGGVATGQKPKR